MVLLRQKSQFDARPVGGGGRERFRHTIKKAPLALSQRARHAEQRKPMPRLRVVAGPSLDALVPIPVNSGVPHDIVSDAFEGQMIAYIKDFPDDEGSALPSEYFDREDRKGVTWSIQVQGRFLRPISADDVLFGNTFDRPLKLPWGSSAALKFMYFIDPALEHDLASSTKPWALSPLISTMPHLAHRRVHAVPRSSSPSPSPSPTTPLPAVHDVINREAWPPFPPPQSLSDDSTQLYLTLKSQSPTPSPSPSPLSSRQSSTSERATTPDPDSSVLTSVTEEEEEESFDPGNDNAPAPPESLASDKDRSKNDDDGPLSANHEDGQGRTEEEEFARRARERELRELNTAAQRRAYFHDATRRREHIFGPEDVFTIDFCYGFIQFAPTLALNLPGGISFDLMRYWDGQPVRFMCCERKRENEDGGADADGDVPWGRVLWCIAIELVADDEQSQPQPQPQPPSTQRGGQ